jgi:hypothetical protein
MPVSATVGILDLASLGNGYTSINNYICVALSYASPMEAKASIAAVTAAGIFGITIRECKFRFKMRILSLFIKFIVSFKSHRTHVKEELCCRQ